MPTVYKGDVKDPAKKAKDLEKLNILGKKTARIIYKISGVFPFTLFPDSIIIDENKVTVINRMFFASEQVFPVLYDSLTGVVIETSILFATLRLEISGFDVNPEPVKFLKVSEARRARRLILGLIYCAKEKIDLTQFDIETVRRKVEEIGAAHAV